MKRSLLVLAALPVFCFPFGAPTSMVNSATESSSTASSDIQQHGVAPDIDHWYQMLTKPDASGTWLVPISDNSREFLPCIAICSCCTAYQALTITGTEPLP